MFCKHNNILYMSVGWLSTDLEATIVRSDLDNSKGLINLGSFLEPGLLVGRQNPAKGAFRI